VKRAGRPASGLFCSWRSRELDDLTKSFATANERRLDAQTQSCCSELAQI
jgi:hypothetical protein